MRYFSSYGKSFLATAFLMMCFGVSAQDQLSHEKKVYQSEGKLYWNKELPVYVRLATSENDKGHLLKSEEHAEYTNPYFFDTEGANYMRTRYAVDQETKQTIIPEIEVLWEVYVDGISPVTAIHYGTSNLSRQEDVLFCGEGLKVELNASDQMSGVAGTYVSIDGAAYAQKPADLKLDKEKLYNLKYYSVDNVGNVEVAKEAKVSLDLTAPKTTHTLGGVYVDNIVSRKATVTLNAEDKISGVSKIMYSIDGSKYMLFGDRIYLSWLTEGEHEIKYYSIDNVNNKEVEKSFKFFMDKTPPTVVPEVVGDMFTVNGKTYFSGRTKLSITAMDNKAGVASINYSVNGGEFAEYDKPAPLPTSTSTLTIRSYGVDKVDNMSSKSDESNQLFIYADLTGPSLSVNYDGPTFETRDTIFISKNTKIQLLATDAKSGVKKITYQINKGAEATYGDPFTVEKEAFHHVDFVGHDNVNNTNKSDFFFYVDNTGPRPYTTYSIDPIGTKEVDGKKVNVFPKHLQVFLSATDAHVGLDQISYSLNDGNDKLYTGIVKNFKKGKVYKIHMKAYDTLGNLGEKDEYFAIED